MKIAKLIKHLPTLLALAESAEPLLDKLEEARSPGSDGGAKITRAERVALYRRVLAAGLRYL